MNTELDSGDAIAEGLPGGPEHYTIDMLTIRSIVLGEPVDLDPEVVTSVREHVWRQYFTGVSTGGLGV